MSNTTPAEDRSWDAGDGAQFTSRLRIQARRVGESTGGGWCIALAWRWPSVSALYGDEDIDVHIVTSRPFLRERPNARPAIPSRRPRDITAIAFLSSWCRRYSVDSFAISAWAVCFTNCARTQRHAICRQLYGYGSRPPVRYGSTSTGC